MVARVKEDCVLVRGPVKVILVQSGIATIFTSLVHVVKGAGVLLVLFALVYALLTLHGLLLHFLRLHVLHALLVLAGLVALVALAVLTGLAGLVALVMLVVLRRVRTRVTADFNSYRVRLAARAHHMNGLLRTGLGEPKVGSEDALGLGGLDSSRGLDSCRGSDSSDSCRGLDSWGSNGSLSGLGGRRRCLASCRTVATTVSFPQHHLEELIVLLGFALPISVRHDCKYSVKKKGAAT